MIWFLIRTAVWVTGFIVVASFVLNYFGYQPNWNYLQERQASCQKEIDRCKQELLDNGTEDLKAHCDIKCVDPELFIQKNHK